MAVDNSTSLLAKSLCLQRTIKHFSGSVFRNAVSTISSDVLYALVVNAVYHADTVQSGILQLE